MMKRYIQILSVVLFAFSLVSCGEKDPSKPKSDQYYHYYGGQIAEVSSVYVDSESFEGSNVSITVPTPDDRLTFEYPLYVYNNREYDLTKEDENYKTPDYSGWGYCIYSERETFYWAEGLLAQSGSVYCLVTRGSDFHAVVRGKFKSNGVNVDINVDLHGNDSYPDYSGKLVDKSPEKNYVSVSVDEVYQNKLSAYYIADESEERATVFVKLAKESYMVFDYDLKDYNGVVFDLSKPDVNANEYQKSYTIAYTSTTDYKSPYDELFYWGEDDYFADPHLTGTCKAGLTFDENGGANFSIELLAGESFDRHVELIFDGPAELVAVRPRPEPSAHKVHRVANGR